MKSSNKENKKNIKTLSSLAAVNFFAEAGLLKNVRRSGWWVAGIPHPESVADHCFRCAIMGYTMAHEEKVDPFKVLLMTLFNDIHEARINDLHKMGHYYIDFKDAEKKVFKDQMQHLNPAVKKELHAIRLEYEQQKTRESILARDADILECLIQAREYLDAGHTKAKKFFQTGPSHLKTKTAKKYWNVIKSWDSGSWWENVVKFDR